MKNLKKFLLFSALVFSMSLFSSGCKTGEGCPTPKEPDLSEYNGKRGKSTLFSKKERKKMGR